MFSGKVDIKIVKEGTMKLREECLFRERIQYRELRFSVLLRCVMTQKSVVLNYLGAEA